MLIRKRSRQAAIEAQWRDEVSAQLRLLMDAQTQMAKVASLQLEDRKHQRPTWMAWIQAFALLTLSASILFSGIVTGIASTTDAAAASSLQAQASTAITRVDNATQPIVSLVNHKGAAWMLAHATKAEVTELGTAERWAKVYHADSLAASGDQRSADRFQLTGPALLALGSALGGAVLGWMLTQWLGSLRWPKKSESRAP